MSESNDLNKGSERTPPRERFAADALQFDLLAEAAKLEGEDGGSHSGHRQVTLYKHEQATVALFRFERNGSLPKHKAPGTVFIQVLEGNIEFDVEGSVKTVAAGGLLALAPGARHDVRALEPSVMLLTVCLQKRD